MLGQIVDSLTRELMTYQYFFRHSLSIPQGSRHTNRNGLSILQLPLSSVVLANGHDSLQHKQRTFVTIAYPV